MSETKLVVIYPRPKDVEAFEKVYLTEHVPMAVEKLAGKTKIVATKITAFLQGTPPFYRIAEIYFLLLWPLLKHARPPSVLRKHWRTQPRSQPAGLHCS